MKYSEIHPEYKRWLRKYLLPEERELHPFTREEAAKFEHQATIAEMVRKVVDDKAKAVGFVISIPDPLAEGDKITQITPPHRMAVIGKLFGSIYGQIVLPMLMHQLYPQVQNYDWSVDPNKYLHSKAVKQAMKAYVLTRGGIKNLTGFGVTDERFLQWIVEGCAAIGLEVQVGEGRITKVIDQDAIDANRVRLGKKDRGDKPSCKTRYDALFTGQLASDLGKKDRDWSGRLTGKNVGGYTRGGDIGIRAPVTFRNAPTRWIPSSASSSSASSSASNAWPFASENI
ncbi:hypothetical protein FACS189472_18730 [Alphaproteobacteria bacterium]|nr:hypothetical protein FACS189472_18730 [Alphaproteobacteria bacterium]